MLNGLIQYDTSVQNHITTWYTSDGIIRPTGNFKIRKGSQWVDELVLDEEGITEKKENIICYADYELTLKEVLSGNEYTVVIDELVIDSTKPKISFLNTGLSENSKKKVTYKKVLKKGKTISLETEYGMAEGGNLYYKFVKKGKKAEQVAWKEVTNNRIKCKKKMKAYLCIRAVDPLGNETVIKTQGFRVR